MEESDGMKKILLVATGGTIASVEDGRGLAPALGGEELARYVPEIADVCDFDVVQPMNIDSTNMRPADWMRIRDEIVDAYDAYDGFVVLHGTDTMAYTAAALSYLVQGSPKPIVLTGSQQPMASPFTDAKLNLYQSLLFAADDRSCDVSVVFGGAVIAGTRARKQRTMLSLIHILRAARFHIRFERIHPFEDGNGRTGRILVNRGLLQAGLAPVVVPFERRAEYLAMLADGDSDGLAEMFRSFSHSEEERIAAFAEAAQE